MQIRWLGQASFYLEHEGVSVLIDPYFSDSCFQKNPNSYRRTPLCEELFDYRPDLIVLTHDHLDHTDPETLGRFLSRSEPITVLCARSSWERVRAFAGNHHYVCFPAGTVWTEGELRFSSVPAVHSDPEAIGVIVTMDGKNYYFTGDTLYSHSIFPHLPQEIEAVFLPINGKGNNMNPRDATEFAERCGARVSVPIHWGMFDEIDPKVFQAKNRILPYPYGFFPFSR